jgi:hypothetical protein
MSTASVKACIGSFVGIAIGLFVPVIPMVLLIGLGIFIDTWAGRWCARQLAIKKNLDPKEEVTSRKTRLGVTSKMLVYQAGLLMFYLIDVILINSVTFKVLGHPFVLTKLTCLFLLWIEYSSVDEKIRWVKGYGIKELFHKFIKELKGGISSIQGVKNKTDKLR